MGHTWAEMEPDEHDKVLERRQRLNSLIENLKNVRLSEFTVSELDIIIRVLGFPKNNFPASVLESEFEKLEHKLKERRLGVHPL